MQLSYDILFIYACIKQKSLLYAESNILSSAWTKTNHTNINKKLTDKLNPIETAIILEMNIDWQYILATGYTTNCTNAWLFSAN